MSSSINLSDPDYEFELGMRDAIHVAILVAESDESLEPGTHVSLIEGSKTKVSEFGTRLIGIVNPFSTQSTYPGIPFCVFIYPNTIVGLRHEWSHPYLETGTVEESKAFIRSIAERCECSYDTLMNAAQGMVMFGDYFHMGQNESYKYKVSPEEWKVFWKHYTNVTGEQTEDNYAPFSCGC